MNILTVLARGIEGCGVTKNSIEFTEYVNSIGNDFKATCIANSDIKWGRGDVHQGNIDHLSFTKDISKVKQYFDDSDVIIFMCTPLKKSDEKIKDNFVELLDYANSCNKFTAYCQFDHKKRSLSTNMYGDAKYLNIFEKFDVVFNHSHTNDFVKKIIEPNKIKIKNLVCRGDMGIENLFGIDFNVLKSKYWKPYDEKDNRTIKFIGRSSGWKGPWLFRDIHHNYLKKNGWISSAEGIELSIGTLCELFSQIKPTKITRDDVELSLIKCSKQNIADLNSGNYELERNMPIYLMPPYVHDYAMERLSKCQFGVELLKLDDNFSKDVIENAMFEIVAVGCIPVFRKQWAEKFLVKGKPLIEYSDICGTVFIDENDVESSLELMNTLADTPKMYDEWRKKAYKFYSNLYDVHSIYDTLISVIMKLMENSNVKSIH